LFVFEISMSLIGSDDVFTDHPVTLDGSSGSYSMPDYVERHDEEFRDQLIMGPRNAGFLALIPLGFKDASMEKEFKDYCRPRLINCQRAADIVLMVAIPVLLLHDMGQYESVPPRNLSHVIELVFRLCLVFKGLLTIVAPHKVSESFVVMSACIQLLPLSKVRCSWLSNEDVFTSYAWKQSGRLTTSGQHSSDTLLILYLTATLSYFFCVIPVRIGKSWLVAAYTCFAYGMFTLWMPEENQDPDSVSVLGTLCFITPLFVHVRMRTEMLQRREFFRLREVQTELINQKILRCEAERAKDENIATNSKDGDGDARSSAISAPTVIGKAIAALGRKLGTLKDNSSLSEAGPDELEEAHAAVKEALTEVASLGQQEHWLIDPTVLIVKPNTVLGSGGFGTVMVGQMFGTEVAVKIPKASGKGGPAFDRWISLLRELRVCRRLRHPNVVFFYGGVVDVDGCDVALVLELVRGMDLSRYIAPHPKGPGVWSRSQIVLDVCSGLAYMHAQQPPVVHCDLKPGNVLVELCRPETTIGNGRPQLQRAKLTDFGLSPVLTKDAQIMGASVRWAAPELFSEEPVRPTPAYDIFSFGYVVYFIACGVAPLAHLSNGEVVEKVRSRVLPALDWGKKIPLRLEYETLCRGCTPILPEERPTSIQLHSTCQSLLRQASSSGAEMALQAPASYSAEKKMQMSTFGLAPKNPAPFFKVINNSLSTGASTESAGKAKNSGESNAKPPDMAFPDLQPTTLMGQRYLLQESIMQMNFPMHHACCLWHSGLKELVDSALELSESHCVTHAAVVAAGQCPQCGLVLHSEDLEQEGGKLRFRCEACLFDGFVSEGTMKPTKGTRDKRQERHQSSGSLRSAAPTGVSHVDL